MTPPVQVVALWGRAPPAHSITAVLVAEDQHTLLTGSREGQLGLWDLSLDLKVSSRQLLFGHAAPVTCLAKARDFEKQPFVVSAAEDGEMCVWDVSRGECVEEARLPFRHSAICYYHSSFRMPGEGWLLCCGHYDGILVLDAGTLDVLHTLTTSQAPDWVSCMCLAHSPRIQEDSLIAVSSTGTLSAWDLSSSISRIQDGQRVVERESRALGQAPCRAIRFCPFTERLLLAIFSSCWKVYDYCDFSLLWTEPSPPGGAFAGGEVLAAYRLIVWTEDGRGFIYQLMNSGLSQSVQNQSGGGRGVLKETLRPLLLCSTDGEDHKSSSCVMGFMNQRKEPFYKILCSGDVSGRVALWHIPDVPVSTLDGSPKEIPRASSCDLWEDFLAHHPLADGGFWGRLWGADGVERGPAPVVSSSLYIPSLDTLVWGCEDGSVVVLPALAVAKASLLEEPLPPKEALPRRTLCGHSAAVTALLYPHGRLARFDPSWLLSGSRDSRVAWWDMFTGEQLHCFALHESGPVTDLLLSSENYRFQGHRLVGCVCGERSVALLLLQERRCLLQASKHLSPVKTLRWHPAQSLLAVGCEDGSVYVWDIETGALERHESGERAKAILASCEDSVTVAAEPLLRAIEGGQGPASPSFSGSCKSGLTLQEEPSSSLWTAPAWPCQGPMTVLPVGAARGVPVGFHLLLFDLESALEGLQSPPPHFRRPSQSNSGPLKRAKTSIGKRRATLRLHRGRGSGPLSASGAVGTESAVTAGHGRGHGGSPKKGKSAARKAKRLAAGTVAVGPVSGAEVARLFLSCLLPWGSEGAPEGNSLREMGLRKALCPLSLGHLSRGGHLALDTPPRRRSQDGNLLSGRVPDLCEKYRSVAQSSGREEPPVLDSLISRMCLVQRRLWMPSESISPQKTQPSSSSARNKRRPGPPSPQQGLAEGVFPGSDNRQEDPSLLKLISCWRDQSIEAVEAMQAVLMAEVHWGRRKTLANGHGPAHGEGHHGGRAERRKSPALTRSKGVRSGSFFPEGEEGSSSAAGTDPRRKPDEPDCADEKKPLPWMAKVCSCKVC
ncbi:WD repeat-containing protein 72 isoform X2 [Anolis carolinensis]|uniref:WD repeat-containing protein 72 isoform X2 n=1 Tax=Anolis carolinensis TaxID=28377 RepID=UPI002F2B5CE5